MHLLNLSISFLFRSGQGHDFSEDRTSYSYLTTFEIKLLSMFESKVIQYQVPYVISNPINFANTSNTSKYCSFLLKNITFVLILFAISLALSPVSFDLQFYCNTLALVQHMLYSTEYPLSDFLNFIFNSLGTYHSFFSLNLSVKVVLFTTLAASQSLIRRG